MLVNAKLIRAYDLRGVVGEALTEADAHALGLSYAATLRDAGGCSVAIGQDGRLSSPALADALAAGLADGGLAVSRIGLGPTGMLYFTVHALKMDGGIMVTGSHNPPNQNGFKLLLGREPVHGEALRMLAMRQGAPAAGGSVRETAMTDAYIERLLAATAGAPALRIGWDPGHGAAAAVLAQLTASLPGEHRLINATVDGCFPGHHPDPSVPANLVELQQLVRNEALDLGIAFDGDGDRIGVVDSAGDIIWADQLLLFLAQDVLRDHPGAPVVADVKSSQFVFDGIAAAGGTPLMSPSGYVLVREAMLAAGAPISGEMSGHLFYADRWYGTDDALHVAMRLLAALGRSGRTLTKFRTTLPPSFATPELRLPCPDDRKAAVLASVAAELAREGTDIDRTDGLRVVTSDGWWLLRSSGTEAKLTARVEGWSAEARDRLQVALFARLGRAGLAAEIPTL